MIALRRPGPIVSRPMPDWLRRSIFPAVAMLAPAIVGFALVDPGLDRVILVFAVIPAIVAIAIVKPSNLVYWLIIWLAAAGLIRRIFDTVSRAGSGGLGDPLLLIEPLVVLLLCAAATKAGAFRNRSRLANAVLVLTVLLVVEAVNPLQGSLLVGLGGLLFFLVPVLAFWIGRSLVDERTLRRLFILIVSLAVVVCGYGLFQQFSGLPSWDRAWVQSSGYAALHVGTVIRAFGTFASSSEYETFLAIAAVICAAGLVVRRWAWISLAVGVLLAVGAFYVSSRGILVLGVVALAVMAAARRRLHLGPALLGGLVAIILLSVAAGHFSRQGTQANQGTGVLAQHQFAGLADPLNAHNSTLLGHFSEMTRGLRSTISNPIGHGTGAVSIAANRFGGSVQGTEVDPSNFGVALGIPGFVCYVLIVILGLKSTYRLAVDWPSWFRLAALGLLIATFLEWSNGGQYAVAWLPWLVLGWVDRTSSTSGPAKPVRAHGALAAGVAH